MILILLLWILLLLFGVKRNTDGGSPLEREQTLALRGICAIEIMIGHIGLATGSLVLYPNRKAGILFVGIFFLLSGYGIAYGADHKEGYFRGFIVKKAVKIILPAYMAFAVYSVILFAVFGAAEWESLFDPAAFFQRTNWYVWEQMAFYAAVCLAYTLLPDRPDRVNLLVTAGSVVFVAAAFVWELDNPYYGSTLCFPLGLYYYQYEERLQEIFDKHFGILLAGSGILLMGSLGCFFLMGNDSVLGNPIARNIAAVCFCVAVLLLLGRFRIGNRCSLFLGSFSYEIFLVHLLVIAFLKRAGITPPLLFSTLCVLVSLGAAFLLHLVLDKIERGGLTRRKPPAG